MTIFGFQFYFYNFIYIFLKPFLRYFLGKVYKTLEENSKASCIHEFDESILPNRTTNPGKRLPVNGNFDN